MSNRGRYSLFFGYALDFSHILSSRAGFSFPRVRASFSQLFIIVSGISGCSEDGLRTRLNAFAGQVETQSPQPMQRLRSMATWPSFICSASIWQRSRQMPHPSHNSARTDTREADEMILAGSG